MNEILDFICIYSVYFWGSFSILLLAIEISSASIYLMFASLAGITTCIFISCLDCIQQSPAKQILIFLMLTTIYNILGYKPLKKLLISRKSGYSNIIGSSCIVVNSDITEGTIGEVKWSGATCRAKTNNQHITVGSSATIIAIEGNIFIIKR